jgi:hypothetical protein
MITPPPAGNRTRETRLLLVTIAVSVGVLLLLARFRFPGNPADRPVDKARAPLERLAAQATYDELASIMADLERRIAPRVWIMRSNGGMTPASLVVAPRLTPDRAVALLDVGEILESATEGSGAEIVAQDVIRGVAVIRVPAVDDGAVPIRLGPLRAGPRYVGVVEATPQGPILRPVYVGRTELIADPRTSAQQLSLAALQHALTRGAAIFTLDGEFLGLVRNSGVAATVVTAEFLRAAADGAQPATNQPRGLLGLEVESLTPALARPTGAERGVVVSFVDPGGPSAKAVQSGDVIQAIDGTPVASIAAFRQQESSRAPGASVALQGVRRGSPLWITVTAADAAEASRPAVAPDDPGFVGRMVSGAGLEVVTVNARGAAALAGLESGDLIVAVDGQLDPDSADIARRYRAADPGTALIVTVLRGQRHRVLALEKR